MFTNNNKINTRDTRFERNDEHKTGMLRNRVKNNNNGYTFNLQRW